MRRVCECRIQSTRVEPSTVGERKVVDSKVREGGPCRNKRSRNCFSHTQLGVWVIVCKGPSHNVGCKITVSLLLFAIAWPNPHPSLKLGIVLVIPSWGHLSVSFIVSPCSPGGFIEVVSCSVFTFVLSWHASKGTFSLLYLSIVTFCCNKG